MDENEKFNLEQQTNNEGELKKEATEAYYVVVFAFSFLGISL